MDAASRYMIPLSSSRSDANKYPQERLGNQFLVAMPNNMAMINRARKIYDRLSEYGDLGHLLWGVDNQQAIS